MTETDKYETAGLYIHIPFCLNKCRYCDFYSSTDISLIKAYTKALSIEMDLTVTDPFVFDTIYFGGGTPSVMDVRDISKIFKSLYSFFSFSKDVEITLEANPGTIFSQQLKEYISMGVNRINIGIQSFQDINLSFLGRVHSGQDGEAAIRWSRKAGFENLGIDLIYGLPNQTLKSLLLDLRHAVEFDPEHLSCYMLTYESGTPLYKALQRGMFTPLADASLARLFEETSIFLTDHGFTHYEISNFARSWSTNSKSNRSRHNCKYWSFKPYIGLGPSAHSFIGSKRYWNHKSLIKYLDRLNSGTLPIKGVEVLNKEQQMIEAIYLGLRKSEGIKIDEFNLTFGLSFKKLFKDVIIYLEDKGFIIIDKNYCTLSMKGMLFSDSVASMFINHM